MLTTATVSELVGRVNCFGAGAWLAQTLAELDLALPPESDLMPVTLPRRAGLTLQVGIQKPIPISDDPRDAFYISLAVGDDTVPMPMGLSAAAETLDTARRKLSSSVAHGSRLEMAGGDRRASFFMDGGRVIELKFKLGLVGFDRIIVARLGAPQDWRDEPIGL